MLPTNTTHTSQTNSTQSDTTRLELRIPVDVKKLIEHAASICHVSMSAFVLQTMRQAAEDVLRRDRVTVVPPDFYEAMIASLEAPAEPDKALVDAARRSREIVRKK
ncbi:DUF1778 domain-containing protein [Streptomyces maoxianensis]|uniref:DUF1778 domain-containing protein n=1 Tax=Streptomyces maoxianensis TaxID=1459942 RepID=A0ABV9GBU8_9ACTN